MGKRLSIFPLPRRSPCTHTHARLTLAGASVQPPPTEPTSAPVQSKATEAEQHQTSRFQPRAHGVRYAVPCWYRGCSNDGAAAPLPPRVGGGGERRRLGARSLQPRFGDTAQPDSGAGGAGEEGPGEAAGSPAPLRRSAADARSRSRGSHLRGFSGDGAPDGGWGRHGTACSAGVRPERHGVKLGPGSGWWWGSARFPPLPPSSAARPARSAQHQPAQHQPARLRTPPSPRTLRRSPAQLRRRAFRNNAPSLCRPKAENNGHAEHLPSTESGASPGPPPPSPPPLLASPPRTLRTSVPPAVGTPRRCPPCPLRSPPGGSYLRGAALPAVLRVRSACSGPPAATGRSAGGGGRRGEWGG